MPRISYEFAVKLRFPSTKTLPLEVALDSEGHVPCYLPGSEDDLLIGFSVPYTNTTHMKACKIVGILCLAPRCNVCLESSVYKEAQAQNGP